MSPRRRRRANRRDSQIARIDRKLSAYARTGDERLLDRAIVLEQRYHRTAGAR